LTRLLGAGARIWRTDLQGNINVTSNGMTYAISASKIVHSVYLPYQQKEVIDIEVSNPYLPLSP
jgi:hypothetical protein